MQAPGFKAQFGDTASEFVRRRRLEFAHEMLTATDLQVRQVVRLIALEMGVRSWLCREAPRHVLGLQEIVEPLLAE